MNINDLPKPNQPNLPAGFFENQANSILKRTLDLENWSLPGTKSIESCYKVPDGYWLSMEDGIRSQIKKQQTNLPIITWKPATQWVMACIVMLVFGIGGVIFWNSGLNPNQQSWSAQIEQVSETELLAYVSNHQNLDFETTESFALQFLDEKDIPTPANNLNETEIESTIEGLSDSELWENIGTN